MTALVADDERIARLAVRAILEKLGVETVEARNGREAVEIFSRTRPAIVLLDVMMPVSNGLEACREIRALDRETPILFLTAKDSPSAEIEGLSTGADGYIPKTAPEEVIEARLAAALRRASGASGGFHAGGWFVEPQKCSMSRKSGENVPLTLREIEILRLLASNPGTPFSKDWLLVRFWADVPDAGESAVSQAISRLRAKLAPEQDSIKTLYARGIYFRPCAGR